MHDFASGKKKNAWNDDWIDSIQFMSRDRGQMRETVETVTRAALALDPKTATVTDTWQPLQANTPTTASGKARMVIASRGIRCFEAETRYDSVSSTRADGVCRGLQMGSPKTANKRESTGTRCVAI